VLGRSSKFALFATVQLVILLSMALYGAESLAQNGPGSGTKLAAVDESTNQVTAKLIADTSAIVPGKPFTLGISLEMIPEWHTYYKISGEAGMPTRVTWTLPPGFTASELLWQKPHKFLDSGITTYGYQDRTLVGATITPPAHLTAGSAFNLQASVKYLACKDMCVPGKASLSLKLPVAESSRGATAANTDLFKGLGWDGPVSSLVSTSHASGSDVVVAAGLTGESLTGSILDAKIKVADGGNQEQSLLAYLAFAFVGGFILNFMPCVLPVISIKVLSFMQQAGDDPKRVFRLGLTFTAGIIFSFMVLAGAVIAVQQAGQKVGWGFQFQYPIFLLCMAAVVLMFALSLFGLFYIQVNAGQDQIDQLASKEGFVGTFFKGVLATTLSTPCSAPFLGTALGFAFSQPPAVVLLMFGTIAVGMSFPYVLLTANPSWMKYLPKPGVWMEKFKESMGFLLLATVVWLVWVLGQQVGINAAMAAVGFLVALSFAVWLVGRFTDLTSGNGRKAVVYGLAAVVLGAAYATMLRPFPELLSMQPPQSAPNSLPNNTTSAPYVVATSTTTTANDAIDWKPFSIKALDEQLASGQTVFVDFTADWCLTCKVNESSFINVPPVIKKFRELNVVAMRADWTRQDAQISQLLQKFGRSGVPLYVIFPAGRPTEPIVLPEVITQDMVIQKLEEAGSSRASKTL